MSDIVTRLRDSVTQARAIDRSALLNEAADEIVKIRREVEDLRDTPPQHPAPGECSKQGEGTSEPVAWAAHCDGEYDSSFCGSRDAKGEAEEWCNELRYENGRDWVAVPLYRSPILTDAEREAIEGAINAEHARGAWKWAATLRGLLERLR